MRSLSLAEEYLHMLGVEIVPYSAEKARLIVQEMTELLALDLVRKGLVTKKLELTLGYDRESLRVLVPGKTPADTVYAVSTTGERFEGKVTADPYGRPHPKHAHGTGNLDRWTNSSRRIMQTMLELFDSVVDPRLLVRRVNIAAVALEPEEKIPEEGPEQLDLFTDYETLEKRRAEEAEADRRERSLQRTTLALQEKYGKNALLKGMNFLEGGTTIERNGQIGGHRSGE